MLTVAEFNSWNQLAQIRLLWQDLWMKTSDRTFFQTYRWFEAYCQNNPEVKNFRVLVVNLEGKPVGLVPLVIRTRKKGLFKYRTLSFPVGCEGMHFGPLGSYPSTTVAAVVKHLQESPRHWDCIDLQHVDVEGSEKNRMTNALTGRGLTHRRELSKLCGKVTMEQDWSDYWYGLPEETHRQFDDAEKRLTLLGKLNYARFSAHRQSNREDMLQSDAFRSLTRMKKVSIENSKVLKRQSWNENEESLLSSLHEDAVRYGTADMHVLYLNDEPYAGIYNYCTSGRVDCQAFFLAFDAIHESLYLLITEMLRSCYTMKDRELYFPAEFYPYTFGWQNSIGTSYRHIHYAASSLKAQCRRMIEWMTREETEIEKRYRTYRETCQPPVLADPKTPSQRFSVVG